MNKQIILITGALAGIGRARMGQVVVVPAVARRPAGNWPTRCAGSAPQPRSAACLSSVFGRPEEVAEAILFLSSGKAEFMTGHILNVDGGKSAG